MNVIKLAELNGFRSRIILREDKFKFPKRSRTSRLKIFESPRTSTPKNARANTKSSGRSRPNLTPSATSSKSASRQRKSNYTDKLILSIDDLFGSYSNRNVPSSTHFDPSSAASTSIPVNNADQEGA